MVNKYVTEFDGLDLKHIQDKMRVINPEFSNEQSFLRDVQMVVDENFLNSILFSAFYKKKFYSITDLLLDLMPEGFAASAPIARAIMNTSVFKFIFPELVREFGENKQIDFRCAFNKDFLQQGHLSSNGLSRITFRDGDLVEGDLNFGCSIYVFGDDKNDKKDPMQHLMQMFASLGTDPEDPAWIEYKTFFMSLNVVAEFDFSNKAKSL